MIRLRLVLSAALLAALPALGVGADDAPSAERGKKALLTRNFTPPSIPLPAYENAWKVWDPKAKERPADYGAKFRERYGLHEAPHPNGDYPMGLRLGSGL